LQKRIRRGSFLILLFSGLVDVYARENRSRQDNDIRIEMHLDAGESESQMSDKPLEKIILMELGHELVTHSMCEQVSHAGTSRVLPLPHSTISDSNLLALRCEMGHPIRAVHE
jgi:hypothetical protein